MLLPVITQRNLLVGLFDAINSYTHHALSPVLAGGTLHYGNVEQRFPIAVMNRHARPLGWQAGSENQLISDPLQSEQ